MTTYTINCCLTMREALSDELVLIDIPSPNDGPRACLEAGSRLIRIHYCPFCGQRVKIERPTP